MPRLVPTDATILLAIPDVDLSYLTRLQVEHIVHGYDIVEAHTHEGCLPYLDGASVRQTALVIADQAMLTATTSDFFSLLRSILLVALVHPVEKCPHCHDEARLVRKLRKPVSLPTWQHVLQEMLFHV